MSTLRAPLVSAVVPVFNGARFLAQALDSAVRQTMGSLEVVVVNDGSTDGSGEIGKRYATNHASRVVYIEQSNLGLPSARNAAVNRARGRYLALLDSDDVWLPDHLATLVPLLEADKSLALAHANITFVDDQGHALNTPQGRWVATEDRDAFRALFLRHQHVSCPTTVLRRDLVLALGGFDTAFSHLGCEDRDLWLRISARHRIRYVPRVTAYYRVHQESMSRNLERMRRARQLLVEKHSRQPPGRGLRREALAAVDVETGSLLLRGGCHSRAAFYFGLGLLRDPHSSAAWRGLAASVTRRGRPRVERVD